MNFPFGYTDQYGFFTITSKLLPAGTYTYRVKGHPPNPVTVPGPAFNAKVGSVSVGGPGAYHRPGRGSGEGGNAAACFT